MSSFSTHLDTHSTHLVDQGRSASETYIVEMCRERAYLWYTLNAVVQQLSGDEAHANIAFGAHCCTTHCRCGEARHLAHELAFAAYSHKVFARAFAQRRCEFFRFASTLQASVVFVAYASRYGMSRPIEFKPYLSAVP